LNFAVEVGSYEALGELGSFHHRHENLTLAETILGEACIPEGHDFVARELGLVKIRLGKYAEAEQVLLSSRQPGDPLSSLVLANLYRKWHNLSLARYWRAKHKKEIARLLDRTDRDD
jgi:hypothetical protein